MGSLPPEPYGAMTRSCQCHRRELSLLARVRVVETVGLTRSGPGPDPTAVRRSVRPAAWQAAGPGVLSPGPARAAGPRREPEIQPSSRQASVVELARPTSGCAQMLHAILRDKRRANFKLQPVRPGLPVAGPPGLVQSRSQWLKFLLQ